jgi:hypothetical protein
MDRLGLLLVAGIHLIQNPAAIRKAEAIQPILKSGIPSVGACCRIHLSTYERYLSHMDAWSGSRSYGRGWFQHREPENADLESRTRTGLTAVHRASAYS